MSFGDGPPYSEDEDLHSPVVMAPHQRPAGPGPNGRQRRTDEPMSYFPGPVDRGALVSLNSDGSETYYLNEDDADDDGPAGELVTYPAREGRYSHLRTASRSEPKDASKGDMSFESDDDPYARDYQFAVGCPDEEMHGKAVALFDFTREHENELPLTEGQVIFVSYRHGQGWLVAEDPKTGESGLVPEEFVRLLRDIEGGLISLNGDPTSDLTGPNNTYLSPESTDSDQALTPTQPDRLSLASTDDSEGEDEGPGPAVASDEEDDSDQQSPAEQKADNGNGSGKRVSMSAQT